MIFHSGIITTFEHPEVGHDVIKRYPEIIRFRRQFYGSHKMGQSPVRHRPLREVVTNVEVCPGLVW
jgi:hypothetical protein